VSAGGATTVAPPKAPARRVTAPQRCAAFAGLDLPELREYRRELRDEESRASYWRRLLQARVDLLAAVTQPGDVAGLRPLLASAGATSRRAAAHLPAHPAGGLPPLPDLLPLWDTVPAIGDAVACRNLLTDLRRAEHELSAYRRDLHDRLDAATRELVARYREDPASCLVALPLRPGG
jgi:hypothetical protein